MKQNLEQHFHGFIEKKKRGCFPSIVVVNILDILKPVSSSRKKNSFIDNVYLGESNLLGGGGVYE